MTSPFGDQGRGARQHGTGPGEASDYPGGGEPVGLGAHRHHIRMIASTANAITAKRAVAVVSTTRRL